MLQIKSYFNEERWCNHQALRILFHIDILNILRGYQLSNQAFKSQMCFEQKSTRDPKVFCSARIKSKRNRSRLDMHREATNCDLSLENVANG